MHSLLRILFVIGILASLLAIYTIEAASILSAGDQDNTVKDKCKPPGAECDGNPPCCNPKCRVNWGGSWCT